MKLAQLHEARYINHDYVGWIEDNLKNPEEVLSRDGKYQGSQLDNVDVEAASNQLTDEYGQPDVDHLVTIWQDYNLEITLYPKEQRLQFVVYIKHPIF